MVRLLVIGFIWLGCTVAWAILGSSLAVRSEDTSNARVEEAHGPMEATVQIRARAPRRRLVPNPRHRILALFGNAR